MYNVLLTRDVLQSGKALIAEFFPIPDDLEKSARVPAGTVTFVQALLTRAEDDWARERAEFRRCFRTEGYLENSVCDSITRMTVAAELLSRCNYAITYRSEGELLRDKLKRDRQPFVDEALRLIRLIKDITAALQVKVLVKEVKNPLPDLYLRGAEMELLLVRKLRMSYADHLANLGARLQETYQSALPVESEVLRLRAQVYRNTAALLIDLSRADEERLK